MPNINKMFNKEIRRMAKKEVKAATEQIRKDHARLKKEMALAKKYIAALVKEVHRKRKETDRIQERFNAVKPNNERVNKKPMRITPDKGARTTSMLITPRSIKALRKKLGLTQEKLALQIGDSTITVSFWERGKISPREKSRKALSELKK